MKLIFALAVFAAFAPFSWAKSDQRTPNHLTSGYERKLFQHWVDADGDCQNTRVEILIQESKEPVTFRKSKKGACSVTKGKWQDFYFDETLTDPKLIDIDHVVPLKHAWDTGASTWTKENREKFANDPLNLVVTNRKYNRQKGAKTILEWMPIKRDYACKYAERWLAIKKKYELSISAQERDYYSQLKCES
jgi:hypothetical protein